MEQEAYAEGAAIAAENAEQPAGDFGVAAPDAAAGTDAAVANGGDNPGHSNTGAEGAYAPAPAADNGDHSGNPDHTGARTGGAS